MAYNEELVQRIRAAVKPWKKNIEEKKMFGGLSFMYKNKMSIGVHTNDIMVRVLEEKMDDLMKRSYVSPMDFTGKPMKEFVKVSPLGLASEEILLEFVELGIEHAESKASGI